MINKELTKQQRAYICYNLRQKDGRLLHYFLGLIPENIIVNKKNINSIYERRIKPLFRDLTDTEKEELNGYTYEDMLNHPSNHENYSERPSYKISKALKVKHPRDIDMEECVVITKKDPHDKYDNQLETEFIRALKELGYSDDEIYREEETVVEWDFRTDFVPTERDYGITKTNRFERKHKQNDDNVVYETYEVVVKQPVVKFIEKGILVDYNLLPKEEVKPLRKNSKIRKKHPEKKYTYELKYIHPSKFKHVLSRKFGYDVANDSFWKNV